MKIEIQIINSNADVTSIKIVNSIRDETFVYHAGYMAIASSACPEYTGDCLYVWGSDTNSDLDICEIPTADMPKLQAALAEVNYNKFNDKSAFGAYVICCDHFYLDVEDCACNNKSCAICYKESNKKDMRNLSTENKEIYICMEHEQDKACPVCDTKHYLLLTHKTGDYNVCVDCVDKAIPYGEQHNYNYKPAPIFHDLRNTTVVTYTTETLKKNKHLSSRLFFGSEVEQQYPRTSNRAILIGRMEQKQGLNFIYCKHDGSIGNGTECVTQPYSWDFFKQHDWDGILNAHVIDWRPSGCSVGHHIHMSLAAFTRLHLFRFLKFHHTHERWVEFISQRGLGEYNKSTGGAMTKALNKGRHGDKYEFLNVTGATLEWRAFASPLTVEEFKKNNEYLHAAYTWTKDLKLKGLFAEDLESFIMDNKKEYPNLVDYIKTKMVDAPFRHTINKEKLYMDFSTKEQREAERLMRRQQPQAYADNMCQLCGDVQIDTDNPSVIDYRGTAPQMRQLCSECYDSDLVCICDDCDTAFIPLAGNDRDICPACID